MGLLANSNAIESGGYNIDRSLRFRSSATAYLNRTPASASNRKTWTWSGWVKRGRLNDGVQSLFTAGSDGTYHFNIYFNGDNIEIYNRTGASYELYYQTSQLFRDASAWYHFVFAIDTTQSTSGLRVLMWINGSLSSTLTGLTVPAQNTDLMVNSAYEHRLSRNAGSSTNYFDGYLAEVNFIDGQALTPSSFGATDATTGVWQPVKYTGTYGTNGFYLPFSVNSASTYAAYISDITSNYNTLPTGSQGSTFQLTGDFTFEGWVLFPSASSGDNSMYVQSDGTNYFALNISMSGGVYNIYCNANSPTGSFSHGIQAGSWTHVAMVRSGSTITLYTNGVSKGTISNSSTLGFSSLTLNRFGGGVGGSCYMSNFRLVKSAVYTSTFTPPTSPLSAISNTLFLTYQNSTAIDNGPNAFTIGTTGSVSFSVQYPFTLNVAADYSGNGNNWTTNNISLTNGATYDSMTDVPTLTSATAANTCTLSPIFVGRNDGGGAAWGAIDGNLTGANFGSGGWGMVGSTMAIPSGGGKYYFEAILSVGGQSMSIGVQKSNTPFAAPYVIGYTGDANGYSYDNSGLKWNNGSTAYGSTAGAGDVIGVAVDASGATSSITFYKNGVSMGSAFTGISGDLMPALSTTVSNPCYMNFGQKPWSYTPPTGFNALNTFNLPDPTIKKPNQYMDVSTWSGDNTTPKAVVSNLAFQPDFLWLKQRSANNYHFLQNSVTGAANYLASNATDAESFGSSGGWIQSFDSNGYTTVAGSSNSNNVNGSGITYVGWSWKESATAGFDIVTYTGDGNANRTVSHNLGVAPKMILVKARNSSTYAWNSYHASLTPGYYIALNTTSPQDGSVSIFPAGGVTASNWNTGGDPIYNNGSGVTYVAYAFAEIAGFSAFGRYTGNGSSDGPFVYCGFQPRYLMIKRIDAANHWLIYDTARDTYNVGDKWLRANSSDAESTGLYWDSLSNGFKIRVNDPASNASGGTYIYAAFSTYPFKFSTAR